MPTLTQFRLCPFSRSIRMLLGELRREVTLLDERPWEWRAEFLRLNPAGELPVMRLDGGEVLCGAYAISEYLAEEVAAVQEGGEGRNPVLPGNRLERAEVRRLVDWFHRKLHLEATDALLEEKVISRLRGSGGTAPDAGNLRAVRANLKYHLGYLDHLASQRRWLAGEEVTYADFAAAAHVSCADYLGEIDWSTLGAARGWYARVKSRPSVRAILAERVPGAPTPPIHYSDPDF
ncbi:MAG: glutathione S-transferase family protein [Hyphomicrobiaceae bacterium]